MINLNNFNSKIISKELISKIGLVLFYAASAMVVIDTIVWWQDGPRYTHEMWYADRLDRINEDIKLQNQINDLKLTISNLKNN